MFHSRTDNNLWVKIVSYTNIKDLVSLWNLIASRYIYDQKKRIEESFMMVIEANDYVKQFPKYQ